MSLMTGSMKRRGRVVCLRKNKYGAKKVTTPDGLEFDSKAEYHRWCELKLLERAGKITDLQRQVKYELLPPIYDYIPRFSPKTGKELKPQQKLVEAGVNYIADFVYKEENGETVVEDVKGYRDPSSSGYAKFVIKRKLMLYLKGIRIREV